MGEDFFELATLVAPTSILISRTSTATASSKAKPTTSMRGEKAPNNNRPS